MSAPWLCDSPVPLQPGPGMMGASGPEVPPFARGAVDRMWEPGSTALGDRVFQTYLNTVGTTIGTIGDFGNVRIT